MYEGGIFNGIDATNLDEVKAVFEQQIAATDVQQGTVMEKNKTVMRRVVSALEPLKSSGTSVPPRVTADDIRGERMERFGKEMEGKQAEFNQLMNTPKPNRPDFSDGLEDQPIGGEMDNLLAQAIARRERDFNVAISTQDVSAAQEWVGAKQVPPATPHGQPITIGESPVKLDVEEIPGKRKVTFREVAEIAPAGPDESELSSFLSALSTSTPAQEAPLDGGVVESLHRIERMLSELIELARKKS